MLPVVCDLDGVVYLSDQPIPGAVEAIADLRAAGHEVVFATNFSYSRPDAIEAKLEAMGVAARGQVITAAMAAAALVAPGERVLVLAGPGVHDELAARGAAVLDATAADEPDLGAVDAVIVGYRDDVTMDHLRRASTAVRDGARFVATGTDPTLPTPDGPVPGAGAIVAAVAVASGAQPVVAGKPHAAMADLVRARLGPVGWMVGDRPETDGAFARALGYGWALTLTGVVGRDDLPVQPEPDVVTASLADFSARLLAGDLPRPGHSSA